MLCPSESLLAKPPVFEHQREVRLALEVEAERPFPVVAAGELGEHQNSAMVVEEVHQYWASVAGVEEY